MKKFYLLLFTTVLILSCVNTVSAVNWVKKSVQFPGDGRENAATFVTGGKAYLGTGYIYKNYNNVFFKDFYQYDSNTEKWTKIADFPGEARYDAIAFSVNGKGYVGLGKGKDDNLKDFYEYNPNNNTWERIADFPDSRRGAVVFVIDNIAYVGTGYDGELKNNFYKYESGQWTPIAALPTSEARDNATAYTLNGKAYIVSGGYGPGVFGGTDSIWEYDPATNTWKYFGYFGLVSNMYQSYVSGDKPYVLLRNELYAFNYDDNRFRKIDDDIFPDMEQLSDGALFTIYDIPYMTLGTYGGFFNPTENLDLWYDADAIKNTANVKSILKDNLSVYPNPVQDHFVISGVSGAQITVSDMTGQLLLKKDNIGDQEIISVPGWNQGIYLLTINKNGSSITQKLIVKK